jgi:hypothetical protein
VGYSNSLYSGFEFYAPDEKSTHRQMMDGDPGVGVTHGNYSTTQMNSIYPYTSHQPLSYEQALNVDPSFHNWTESPDKRRLPIEEGNLPKSAKRLQRDYSQAPQEITGLLADYPPTINMTLKLDDSDGSGPAPVDASNEPIQTVNENDVLSGRGGATNIHSGNRNFRDLINCHRKPYLQARKNDKPAISRAIVRAIRESGGRFLKKPPKSNLWYEIGDDAAREKASQALRQRAPEMRKLLFKSEFDKEQNQQQRQQRLITMMMKTQSGDDSKIDTTSAWPVQARTDMMSPRVEPVFVQATAAHDKFGVVDGNHPLFSGMVSAALTGNGMNRFASNGA